MSKLTLPSCSVLLLSALAGCSMLAPPPAELDVRMTRPTAHMAYVVALRPMRQDVPINELHSWEIRVTSAAGVPVPHARIGFDGGMPQHHHGFPTSPRVTEELGDGRYRLDGMKFSMTGWWEMKLTIDSEIGPDQVTFNTVIATPAARVAVAVASAR
jgi:hypothetical protein